MEVIQNNLLNKQLSWSLDERKEYNIDGLLPAGMQSQRQKIQACMERVKRKIRDYGRPKTKEEEDWEFLEQYIELQHFNNKDEKAFFALLQSDIAYLLPIVYTPIVGRACQKFSTIFDVMPTPHGVYIRPEDGGSNGDFIKRKLAQWPHKDIKVIVITDGERILGLGDLGANGMPIPIGKLQLYTVCAGIHPKNVMPVMMDVGTDKPSHYNKPDSTYVGLRRPRVRGERFYSLFADFVHAVHSTYAHTLIQCEDFANSTAFKLLADWRTKACLFNDDIQGTSAVAVAGLYSSVKITGKPLKDMTVLFMGAGEAGTGIADLFAAALENDFNVPMEQAVKKCWLFDSKGVLHKGRLNDANLPGHKKKWCHDFSPYGTEKDLPKTFLDGVKLFKPDAIIGVAAVPGSFTREILETMAEINERPIIMALSNPTSKAECSGIECIEATKGRGIFASGSPFGEYTYHEKRYVFGQGNNAYIFPAMGLGLVMCQATEVPDSFFLEAARTLADQVTDEELATTCLYPIMERVRESSSVIAAHIATLAWEKGITKIPRPREAGTDLETCTQYMRDHMYNPNI